MVPLSSNNGALTVDVDMKGRKIIVGVTDFVAPFPQFGTTIPAALIYYFDFSLHPLRVGTSTHYDLMAEWMVTNGWLEKAPDKTYFDEYLKSIERWDGTRFVDNLPK